MLAVTSVAAMAQSVQIEARPGKPVLLLGSYGLAAVGYEQREYFISGTAHSFSLVGPATADGKWNVRAADTAPFETRMVVVRPIDRRKFNGTVLVEWLNVTAGQDTAIDWLAAHREFIRRGYAYVAVSAQKAGVEGAGSAIAMKGAAPLEKADPERYGSLSHPGDAFSYDMFSQAGSSVKAARDNRILGGLVPHRVLGIGESQSAIFLTTYVNAIDPVARVFDGFFVHSRFGGSASLDGSDLGGSGTLPGHVRFRDQLRVPVLALITETDLLGARVPGYLAARRADHSKLRVWEVAGTSHGDNYLFAGAIRDSGLESSAELARIYRPTMTSVAGSSSKPFNPGMAHHYVAMAALRGLDRWIRTGRPPRSMPPLSVAAGGEPGGEIELELDSHGLAKGGVRTPWVDVPTMWLSGKGDPGSFIGMYAGSGEPFEPATIAQLYPGGKADYLRRFRSSLELAVSRGILLAEDEQEILDIAAENFPMAP